MYVTNGHISLPSKILPAQGKKVCYSWRTHAHFRMHVSCLKRHNRSNRIMCARLQTEMLFFNNAKICHCRSMRRVRKDVLRYLGNLQSLNGYCSRWHRSTVKSEHALNPRGLWTTHSTSISLPARLLTYLPTHSKIWDVFKLRNFFPSSAYILESPKRTLNYPITSECPHTFPHNKTAKT